MHSHHRKQIENSWKKMTRTLNRVSSISNFRENVRFSLLHYTAINRPLGHPITNYSVTITLGLCV
jgi:hypothetical protein